LGLPGEQFLQARLVLEGQVRLGLVIGQRFFEPLGLAPFVLGGLRSDGRSGLIWRRVTCGSRESVSEPLMLAVKKLLAELTSGMSAAVMNL